MKQWFSIGFGLVLFLLPHNANATLITPTSVFASTYFQGLQSPNNLINNSGLDISSGNVLTYTHGSDVNAATMWAAGAGQGIAGSPSSATSQYVVFNLDASYDLSSAYLWQMLQPTVLGRGIKEFELYASPAGASLANAANPPAAYDLTGFTQILSPTELAMGSGTSTPTQTFALNSATNVRQVYLKINSVWSGAPNEIVGLSEIKFEGTPTTVQPINWNNAAGGSWQTGGNWSTAVAPTASDSIAFNLNDTYTVTSESNSDPLHVYVSAGNVKLSLGSTTLQASTINLSGGKFSVPSLVPGAAAAGEVGYTSALHFTDGTLEIDGGVYRQPIPATITTLLGGTLGAISETFQNTWAFSGAAGAPGTPTLDLVNGATTQGSTASFGSILVGLNGGKGAINVRGAGSSITTSTGGLYFGQGGTMIGGDFYPSESTATVSDHALASGSVSVIIGSRGASSAVTVDNATLQTAAGDLYVGRYRFSKDPGMESNGSLTVVNEGQARGRNVYIGFSGGTGGTLVDGEGSSITATTGGLFVGRERFRAGPEIAAAGNGTLTLTNRASAAGVTVNIGTQGGFGVANVSDGATLAATTGWLLVGSDVFEPFPSGLSGQGTLNVTDGGIVTSFQGTYIGSYNGGIGYATVSGTGSSLTAGADGALEVGVAGTGTLTVADGGTVNSGSSMNIGIAGVGSYFGTGTAGVDGLNSSLNVNGNLTVGKDVSPGGPDGTPGIGALTISGGGHVGSTGEVLIGIAGGRGSVVVGKSDGTDVGGSNLSATTVRVGQFATRGATLDVNQGGTVTASDLFAASPTAVHDGEAKINLAGGVIKAGRTNFSSASYFNWTSGTLWLTGGTSSTSWAGPSNNDTLLVPTDGLLKGSSNLNGQLTVLGTLSPGDDHDTAMFNSRNLTIGNTNNQGTLAADIDFAISTADLLNVNGTVDLTNAKLSLSLLEAPDDIFAPLTFLLINNDGGDAVTGNFASVDLGAFSSFQFSIDYAFSGAALNGIGTGNDVAITFTSIANIPEPSTFSLMLLTAGVLASRRRSVL